MNTLVKNLTLATTLLGSLSATAGLVTVYDNPFRGGRGGEFTFVGTPYVANYNVKATVDLNGAAAPGVGFQTFCMELSEGLVLNSTGTTYAYVESDRARDGSVGPVGDPLSKGAAWLYEQFADGVLPSYNYLGTPAQRRASANLLQAAFWMLEGEMADNLSNPYLSMAATHFGSLSTAETDDNGAHGVRVLNMYTANRDGSPNFAQRRQDVLVRVKPVADGGATVSMLGMGLLLAVAMVRRKEQEQSAATTVSVAAE